jgi:hypothetical protein
MQRVFISYRRDDSAYVVEIIRTHLAAEFGEASVFTDIDSIPLGVDFRETINSAVADCSVLLAVIGDKWTGLAPEGGLRRIDSPDDFVRVEIEAALSRSIPVVPVLVGKAEVPSADLLPATMKPLVFRNATEVRHGPHLKAHLDALARGLAPYLREPMAPPPPAKMQRSVGKNLLLVLATLAAIFVGVLLLKGEFDGKKKSATNPADEAASAVEATPAPATPGQ